MAIKVKHDGNVTASAYAGAAGGRGKRAAEDARWMTELAAREQMNADQQAQARQLATMQMAAGMTRPGQAHAQLISAPLGGGSAPIISAPSSGGRRSSGDGGNGVKRWSVNQNTPIRGDGLTEEQRDKQAWYKRVKENPGGVLTDMFGRHIIIPAGTSVYDYMNQHNKDADELEDKWNRGAFWKGISANFTDPSKKANRRFNYFGDKNNGLIKFNTQGVDGDMGFSKDLKWEANDPMEVLYGDGGISARAARFDAERTGKGPQQRQGGAPARQAVDPEERYTARQMSEIQGLNSALEDARRSGKFSPEEMDQLEKQAFAKRMGIRPLPMPKNPPEAPQFHTDDQGNRWINNNGKWESVASMLPKQKEQRESPQEVSRRRYMEGLLKEQVRSEPELGEYSPMRFLNEDEMNERMKRYDSFFGISNPAASVGGNPMNIASVTDPMGVMSPFAAQATAGQAAQAAMSQLPAQPQNEKPGWMQQLGW